MRCLAAGQTASIGGWSCRAYGGGALNEFLAKEALGHNPTMVRPVRSLRPEAAGSGLSVAVGPAASRPVATALGQNPLERPCRRSTSRRATAAAALRPLPVALLGAETAGQNANLGDLPASQPASPLARRLHLPANKRSVTPAFRGRACQPTG